MTELRPDMRDALEQVHSDWDAARTERTLGTLPARGRSRRAGRRAAALGASLCVLVGGATLAWRATHGASAELASATGAGTPNASAVTLEGIGRGDTRRVRLHDGSEVELLDAAARLELEHSDERLVALQLRGGRARFAVTKRAARRFRVRSGEVTVEVLGTRFHLEPRAAQTWVAVSEGRVRVSWPGGERHLTAGESGLFPPSEQPAQPSTAAQPGAEADAMHSVGDATNAGAAMDADAAATDSVFAVAETARAATPRGTASAVGATAASGAWRERAARGEFSEAYALLKRPGARAPGAVEELLLAADAARLSGHPADAVPFLKRVMAEHPRDARAPLAAFTLGNVLLNQLGMPREAEAAYARARRDTSSTALSQDALARQVEAAHRAGDDALARQLAERYVAEYPQGRRVHAVRRFGGL